MKTLIINNHTQHLEQLVLVFPNATVLEKEKLQYTTDLSNYDLLVFSGGSNVPTVLRHLEEYRTEIEVIKNTTIPVIGICLGAEIITKAFGGELKELTSEHRGIIELEIINSDLQKKLGVKNIKVTEGHHIGIKTMPLDFISYAKSEHGIEIIKHKSKPIIAIQFHPEVSENKNIIEWLLKEVIPL